MKMTAELRKKLIEERKRAERDAEMSTAEDDLAYHNGEIDGLGWAIYFLDQATEVN